MTLRLDRSTGVENELLVRRLERDRSRRLSASTRRRFTVAAVMADLLGAGAATATALLFVGQVRAPFSVAFAIAAWLAIAGTLGLYAWRHTSGIAEAEKVVATTAVGTLLVVLATGATGTAIAAAAIAGSVWSGSLRWMRRSALARVIARGDLRRRTLIVGSDKESGLSFALADEDTLDPVGMVTPDRGMPPSDGLALVGTIADLPRLIKRMAVERVVVPAGALDEAMLTLVLDVSRRAGIEATVRTPLPAMRPSRISIEPLGGAMSLTVHPATLSRWQAFWKRAVDLAIAVPVIVLALPLWLLIAAAIRVDSRGPVLFTQERATKGGRPFKMLKFRTMVTDAEAIVGDEQNRPFFKVRGDARVTRVGRVLRKLSLDELPQLWNVVRGEMSLVGPRPLPIGQVREHWGLLGPRHEVRAGLTGWWQINGRDDTDLEGSLAQDVYYIRNWSVLLDLYIIWRTLGAIVDRRGDV